MNDDVLEIGVKGVSPTGNGTAVFLGNDEKTFVIYVDQFVGNQLTMALNQTQLQRPLTHDLVKNIFSAFGISIKHTVIVDMHDGIFFARIILEMANEICKKIVEVDSRPSDAILLVFQSKKPIFIKKALFKSIPDVTELFSSILKNKN